MNRWHTTDVIGGLSQMAAWLETSQYVQKIMACMQGFPFPWSLYRIHDKTLHLIRASLESSAWELENMGSGQFGTICVCQRGMRDKVRDSTSSLVEETEVKLHHTRICNTQHANSHPMLSGIHKDIFSSNMSLRISFNFSSAPYPDFLCPWFSTVIPFI